MFRRTVVCSLLFALVTTLGVALPAGAATRLAGTGAGVANVGTVTTSDVFRADGSEVVTANITGATMTGVLRLPGGNYVGSFRVGRMGSYRVFPPQDCGSIFGCQSYDISNSEYPFTSGPGELHGSNSNGDHVDGYCNGGGLVLGGIAGNYLDRKCTVKLNGGEPATFQLSVEWLVPTGLGTPDGSYCANPIASCGVALDTLGLIDTVASIFQQPPG